MKVPILLFSVFLAEERTEGAFRGANYKYSRMLKSECPKSRKCQNLNVFSSKKLDRAPSTSKILNFGQKARPLYYMYIFSYI